MARIAVMVADLFEDVEYEKPVAAFRQEGHSTVNVGLQRDETVKGKKGKAEVNIDRAIEEVSADDFDAVFIPGGCSPDKLRGYDDAVTLVREFVQDGKPVFAICHAPQLFITADVVKGRRMTSWKTVRVDLKNAGADVRDEEVVIDGNIITSRGPRDIPAFINACLQMLKDVHKDSGFMKELVQPNLEAAP
jgi:protease I